MSDIIIGIVGAFVGGWLFSRLGVSAPFGVVAVEQPRAGLAAQNQGQFPSKVESVLNARI